jgi:glycosyltransferase involved in cell wall biosynthesis
MEIQKKLRIGFLNDSSRIGGAEKSLAFLIKNLNSSVFESVVICPKGGPLIDELASQNIHVIARDISRFSRKHRVFNYVASLFKLLYLIKKLRIDIIHCNTIGAAHWGLPIGSLLSRPVVCHIRSSSYTKFSSFVVKFYKHSRFIAISHFVKQSLTDVGVPDDKIAVVYNGVDTDLYNPDKLSTNYQKEFEKYREVLKIGVLGRIETWKRHIDVLEAAGMIRESLRFHLFIVGEVWDQKDLSLLQMLKSRINDLRLNNHVTFTGFRKDIPAFMAGLDVIVVPSEGEPFGRVTIEAMAIGKPVIGTMSGCTPEIIQDGVNGILVPVKSPGAIARALQVLANNPAYAARLGRQARRRVIDAFSIGKHALLVQSLYLEENHGIRKEPRKVLANSNDTTNERSSLDGR